MISKIIMFQLIIFILLFGYIFNCSDNSEFDNVKNKLEINKSNYTDIVESFYIQKDFQSIIRHGDNDYSIDGNRIILLNQIFKDSTLNPNDIEIKIKKNYDETYKLSWYVNAIYGLSVTDLLKWIDFLKINNLICLRKDSDVVYLEFWGGFVGDSSGLIYIPIGNEKISSKYYPIKPDYFDDLQKIDDRWYYYVD